MIDDIYQERIMLTQPYPLLNNIEHCHNCAVQRLMRWYTDALKNKGLLGSVVSIIKDECPEDSSKNIEFKKDVSIYLTKMFDYLYFEKVLSKTVNNVLKKLNEFAKEGRIDKLLRFDPYYVRSFGNIEDDKQ